MATKKKVEKADDLVAASSASGFELFKESIPQKISTADVWGNKNQPSPKESRQLEAPGTYDFAGEEDTLMGRLAKRMAARDYIDKQNLGMGTKAQKAATADTKEVAGCHGTKEVADDTMQEFMRAAPGKMVLGNEILDDLQTGIKIEEEHKDTVAKIKSGKIKSDEEAYKAIATDHLKEHPDYYDKKKGLPAMEKKLESASMEDNHLIKQKYEDLDSVTPDYWDKIQRIKGRELDASGINAKLRKKANATPGAPAGDYTESKTEPVMPGATMADQAKNTGRVIGKGLDDFNKYI